LHPPTRVCLSRGAESVHDLIRGIICFVGKKMNIIFIHLKTIHLDFNIFSGSRIDYMFALLMHVLAVQKVLSPGNI
jgi:hypothetical protein